MNYNGNIVEVVSHICIHSRKWTKQICWVCYTFRYLELLSGSVYTQWITKKLNGNFHGLSIVLVSVIVTKLSYLWSSPKAQHRVKRWSNRKRNVLIDSASSLSGRRPHVQAFNGSIGVTSGIQAEKNVSAPCLEKSQSITLIVVWQRCGLINLQRSVRAIACNTGDKEVLFRYFVSHGVLRYFCLDPRLRGA